MTREELIELVKSIKILNSLSDDEIEDLLNKIVVKKFHKARRLKYANFSFAAGSKNRITYEYLGAKSFAHSGLNARTFAEAFIATLAAGAKLMVCRRLLDISMRIAQHLQCFVRLS